MLDDGRGGGAIAAALVRMALLLLALLGCIRAGRCLVDYYCTGESRIPSEFGLTMPGGMGWPPYRLCPMNFKDMVVLKFRAEF